MAEKEQDNYKDIVFGCFKDIMFGYFFVPTIPLLPLFDKNGNLNDNWDVGCFSIALYEDGRLVHTTYLLSFIKKKVTQYKISINTVKAIKALIEERQEDIDSFDQNLWNSMYDERKDTFIFNGKKIATWNIGITEQPIELDKREETEEEEEEWEREKEIYPHIYKYRQYMKKYGTKVEAEIKAKEKAKMEAKIRAEKETQKAKLIIKEERKILSVFEAITQLLEQDGVKLKLAKVNFDDATLDAR